MKASQTLVRYTNGISFFSEHYQRLLVRAVGKQLVNLNGWKGHIIHKNNVVTIDVSKTSNRSWESCAYLFHNTIVIAMNDDTKTRIRVSDERDLDILKSFVDSHYTIVAIIADPRYDVYIAVQNNKPGKDVKLACRYIITKRLNNTVDRLVLYDFLHNLLHN